MRSRRSRRGTGSLSRSTTGCRRDCSTGRTPRTSRSTSPPRTRELFGADGAVIAVDYVKASAFLPDRPAGGARRRGLQHVHRGHARSGRPRSHGSRGPRAGGRLPRLLRAADAGQQDREPVRRLLVHVERRGADGRVAVAAPGRLAAGRDPRRAEGRGSRQARPGERHRASVVPGSRRDRPVADPALLAGQRLD